jgi:hypothetical protein
MKLPRFDGEAEHPLQDRQLAIDLAGRDRPSDLWHFLPCAVPISDSSRWASEVRIGHSLRDVRTDVAGRDRRQPLVPKERREVLVDPPLGIDVRALAVCFVVVELESSSFRLLRGYVQRGQLGA